MTDSNQARKNASRRRNQQTGQGYQAAQQAVQRERMGFDDAAGPTEYRPQTAGTGYFCAWGAEELLGTEQLSMLVEHAEQHGRPDAADKIMCSLCDKPIDVTREPEVHVGLALREDQPPGEPVTEMTFPVWTHESCGHTRVWSWSQLTLERRRRGLRVDTADLPPKEHRRNRVPVEDYFMFTASPNSAPLFYLQPGSDHRHGPLGFRADRLSDGLPALDLSRQQARTLPEWSIAADRTGLSHVERQGTGRWYQPPRPWSPPAAWLAAAHYHQSVIFLTAPAGSVPTAQLETGTGDLSALLAVGRADLLFGARMTVTGLA
ncbi:hypothetical protein [Streptomyces sp. NPDC055036]